MPRTRKRSSKLAIDTVPLPEKVVRGRLDKLGDAYVLTVGARKMALSVGTLVDPAAARKLAGRDVAVAFSAKAPSVVVAIGAWPPPKTPAPLAVCYWWLCYVPAWQMLKKIQPQIVQGYQNEFVRAGFPSSELLGMRMKAQPLSPR